MHSRTDEVGLVSVITGLSDTARTTRYLSSTNITYSTLEDVEGTVAVPLVSGALTLVWARAVCA